MADLGIMVLATGMDLAMHTSSDPVGPDLQAGWSGEIHHLGPAL